MKKIKRILSLVLVFAMLALALTSCTVTAEDRVAAAMLKMAMAKKSDCTANINVKMSVGGITTDMPMTMVLKSDETNAQNPVVYMEMSMSIFGQTAKTTMFYKDGYLYTDAYGSKTKVQMNYEDVMNDAAGAADITSIFDMKKDAIDDSFVITENDDGTLSVKMTITKEEFAGELASFTEQISSSVGNGSDLEMSDTVFEFTIDKNNNVSTVKATLAMKMTIEGQKTDISYVMDFKYNVVGADFVVPTPTDLSSYR